MTEDRDMTSTPEASDFEKQVAAVLNDNINPALASHGGWVRLVKVDGRDVHLELGGGCRGCPGARMTMRYVVEDALRKSVSDIGQVIDATGI